MRRPDTDERNVQPADVLCDFCARPWSGEDPIVEGHRGSCICGRCLTVAYADVVLGGHDSAPDDYACPMCLEANADRAALGRADEPGWRSPAREEAVICRRCIKMAAAVLHKSRDFDWTKPTAG